MFERCLRCGSPAGVVMSFDYGARSVWLDDLVEPVTTGAGYALCLDHGDRMTPPVGWMLTDRRSPETVLFATVA